MESQQLPVPPSGGLRLESLPVEPLLTQDFDHHPDLFYQRLRRQYGPVAPVDLAGVPVWLVLGYEEVRGILHNERLWRRDIRYWQARAEGRIPADWPFLPGYELRHTMFIDGDEHRACRRTFDTALRPFQDTFRFRGRQLQEDVFEFADHLISVMANGSQAGRADLCSQYAWPLTLMVINRLYGFPAEQAKEVMADIWQMIDGGEDALEAVKRVLAAMTQLAAARRTTPGDDLASHMLAADPSLTPERLGRELFMAVVYLSDVTSNLISNTLAELLRGNAGARSSLSLGLIMDTINRVAVANPPIANLTFRFPARDTWLGQFAISAGDPVVASVAAAHTDAFALGLAADPAFTTGAHLAWGAGPHQCPRAARELATTIVSAAIGRLTHWFTVMELTLPADQWAWRSAFIRGVRSLPIRFEMLGMAAEPKGDGTHQAVSGSGTAAALNPCQSPRRRYLTGLRFWN